MVVFPPPCVPRVLDAYPNIPINASVNSSITHDYNIGTQARYRNPSSLISIHDRTDLYSLSHFHMRQRLDSEGKLDEIVIIDGDTAANHAVWFVRSTFDSEFISETDPPPKEYPGEVPLWKLHILTQDLPIEFDFEIGGGKSITENFNKGPYDPHDPQVPPYTGGADYSKKEDAYHNAWYAQTTITARPGEYEFSDDERARKQPQFWPPNPPYVVRLTKEAAREAGLLVEWQAWAKPLPGPRESIKFDVHYDWDSPKWAWDGMTHDSGTAIMEHVKKSSAKEGIACQLQVTHRSNLAQSLPLLRGGRVGNESVGAIA